MSVDEPFQTFHVDASCISAAISTNVSFSVAYGYIEWVCMFCVALSRSASLYDAQLAAYRDILVALLWEPGQFDALSEQDTVRRPAKVEHPGSSATCLGVPVANEAMLMLTPARLPS